MRPPSRKPVTPRTRLSPETVFRASQSSHPPSAPRPDLGPRPLSATQRALNEAKSGQAPTPELVPAVRARGKTVHIRDAQTSSRTVHRTNRRRRNVPRLLLGWASLGLILECAAALCWSPRFNIRQVTVSGNHQITTDRILDLAGVLQGRNLVRLPTGRIEAAMRAEPTFETVTIQRSLPATVHLIVAERQPWASVSLPDGRSVTIDKKMVPFRVTKVAEAGLPRLILSANVKDAVQTPGAVLDPPAPVTLGAPLQTPGLSQVSRCLEWARAEPDFKVESVEIAPDGKLCLNRAGGVQVMLGSETDLEKKLKSLGLLLMRRPDLRREARVAYVNLYAYDAPALGPAPKPTAETAPAMPDTEKARTAPKSRRAKARRTVHSTPTIAG